MPRIWKPLNKSVQTKQSKGCNVPQILWTPIRPRMIFFSWNYRWKNISYIVPKDVACALRQSSSLPVVVPKIYDFVSWSWLISGLETSWICTPCSSNVLCWFRLRAPLCATTNLTNKSYANFYALYCVACNRGNSNVVRGKRSPPKLWVVLQRWDGMPRSNCGEIRRPWASVGVFCV